MNGSGPSGAAAVAGARRAARRERAGGGGGGGGDTLASPLQGTVLKVAVEQGAPVEEGALVCVIEAMKMENEITAHKAGKVAELPIAVGASVASGDTLAVISSSSDRGRLRAGQQRVHQRQRGHLLAAAGSCRRLLRRRNGQRGNSV